MEKQREIKFRVWLNEVEEMIPAEQVLGIMKEPTFEENDFRKHRTVLRYSKTPITKGGYEWDEDLIEYCRIMQYTGIKDKYKTEVYEGDILEAKNQYNGNVLVGVVEWQENGYFIASKENYTPQINSRDHASIKVIGNRFENPELLNN